MFQTIEVEGMLLKSFDEASITLIITTNKKGIKGKENYTPLFFINTDTKSLTHNYQIESNNV